MTVDDIALTLEEGLNYAATAHLLGVFASATGIYTASYDALVEMAELKPETARNLLKKQYHKRAQQEMAYMAANGITAVVSTSMLYPRGLLECNDYPHVLYVKGNPEVLTAPMLSLVGTRKPTTYGLSVCNRLVEGLAALMPDLVIVSGLAYGIDAACHRAALAYGLRTVGVLGNPLPQIYPSVHRGLADDMARRGGAVISELHSTENPTKVRFLQRNRIVAGMGEGTIVVQSPLAGGSMITASLADGYHRTVMAPPANIGEQMSAGTNGLIRSLRARMVCSATDVLEELGWQVAAQPQPQPENRPVAGKQKAVYDCLADRGRMALEDIGLATSMGIQELIGVLMELEFDGYVRSLPGNNYEKF